MLDTHPAVVFLDPVIALVFLVCKDCSVCACLHRRVATARPQGPAPMMITSWTGPSDSLRVSMFGESRGVLNGVDNGRLPLKLNGKL